MFFYSTIMTTRFLFWIQVSCKNWFYIHSVRWNHQHLVTLYWHLNWTHAHTWDNKQNRSRATEKVPFKGTVSVISCDPPCKDCNARFTTVTLSDQLNKHVFVYLNCLFSFVGSLQKWLADFLLIRSNGDIIRLKYLGKQWYLPYFWPY